MNRQMSSSTQRLNAGFQRMGQFISRGLQTAATIGIGALVAGVGIATREFIRLDEAVTQAGAKFKDLDTTAADYRDRLKELQMAARAVGAETEFSATDAAGALDKMAMAGLSSVQSMALLRGTTDLATSANTDLTTAVDIATDSLGAFNLMTDDAAQLQTNLSRVSDVMAKTTTTANTSLTEMFEAVKSGAPAFTAAGQSIEDFAALTGILANSGLKGSEAGTALRNVMLRLANPTGEAADVIKELGIRTQDQNGNFRNIVDIIGDFEKGLEGMGDAQRTAALSTVFGARVVTSMNVLLAEGSDSLGQYRDSLQQAGGASAQMAESMRGSIQNRLKVLQSSAIEMGLRFVEAFEDKGVSALNMLIDGVQSFDMNQVLDFVNRAIQFIKNLTQEFTPLFNIIKETFVNLYQEAKPIVIGIFGAVKNALLGLQPAFALVRDISRQVFTWFRESGALDYAITLLNNVGNAVRFLGNIFRIVWNIVRPILNLMFKMLEPIFNLVNNIAGGLGNVMNGISGFVEGGPDRRAARQERRQERRQARVEAQQQYRRRGGSRTTMQQAEVEQQRSEEDTRQRHDIYMHAPVGYGMSGTPGGSPTPAMNLGEQ
jgi:TP901 family phage tail tape measure protein